MCNKGNKCSKKYNYLQKMFGRYQHCNKCDKCFLKSSHIHCTNCSRCLFKQNYIKHMSICFRIFPNDVVRRVIKIDNRSNGRSRSI